MDINGRLFGQMSPLFARVPLLPHAWSEVLAGEFRIYRSDLRAIDCQVRLSDAFNTNQVRFLQPTGVKLIGDVADKSFRLVSARGLSSSTGIPLTLFGTLSDLDDGTEISLRLGVNRLFGIVFCVCSTLASLFLIVGVGQIGSSDNNWGVILVLWAMSATTAAFLSFAFWFVRSDWDLKQFEVAAGILHATQATSNEE